MCARVCLLTPWQGRPWTFKKIAQGTRVTRLREMLSLELEAAASKVLVVSGHMSQCENILETRYWLETKREPEHSYNSNELFF